MTRALINELREPPTEPVRLPRVGGPLAGETTLAEANDASFRMALQSLTRLVPGHAFGTWGQNVDSGTLSVAQGASLHQRFDARSFVERYLSTADLGGERLKVIRETARIAVTDYSSLVGPEGMVRPRTRPGALVELLHRGYSLVVDGIDLRCPETAELARIVERLNGVVANINGYIGYSNTQAFGYHWDDHEVLILPLLGTKHWRVSEPADLSMEKGYHPAPESEPDSAWQGDVGPGSSLLIPRGWGHRVTAESQLTFHLTVSVRRKTVMDLMASALNDPDAALTEVPAVSSLATPQDLTQTSSDLAEALMPTITAHQATFIAGRHIEITSRRVGGAVTLGRADTPATYLRDPHGGGWLIGTSDTDSRVTIAAGKRFWDCDPKVAELLLRVCQSGSLQLGDLAQQGFDEPLLRAVQVSGLLDSISTRTPLDGQLSKREQHRQPTFG